MSDYIIDQQDKFDDTDFLYEEFLKTANDWRVTFRTHKDFCDALHHTKNLKHELAKRIKINKDKHLDYGHNFDVEQQRSVDNYYSNLPNWAK